MASQRDQSVLRLECWPILSLLRLKTSHNWIPSATGLQAAGGKGTMREAVSSACSQPSSQLRVNTEIGSGGVRKGGRVRPVGRMAGCGTGYHSGHPRLGTIVQGSLRFSTLWGFRGSDIPSGTRACPTRVSYMGLFLWRCPWHQPPGQVGKGQQWKFAVPSGPSQRVCLAIAAVFLCTSGLSHSHAMITGISLYI